MITDQQVALLRQKQMEGKSQETAAARAGMSVRSARNWQSCQLRVQIAPLVMLTFSEKVLANWPA